MRGESAAPRFESQEKPKKPKHKPPDLRVIHSPRPEDQSDIPDPPVVKKGHLGYDYPLNQYDRDERPIYDNVERLEEVRNQVLEYYGVSADDTDHVIVMDPKSIRHARNGIAFTIVRDRHDPNATFYAEGRIAHGILRTEIAERMAELASNNSTEGEPTPVRLTTPEAEKRYEIVNGFLDPTHFQNKKVRVPKNTSWFVEGRAA